MRIEIKAQGVLNGKVSLYIRWYVRTYVYALCMHIRTYSTIIGRGYCTLIPCKASMKYKHHRFLRQPADKTKVYVSWGTEVLLNGNGDDLPVIQIIKIRNHRQLFRSN